MHDSISTAGPERPRVRRGLGLVVGVAVLATPMAMAPAAFADGGLSNVNPDSIGATLPQVLPLLGDILDGLPGTLPHLLGQKAQNATTTCTPGYVDGLGSSVTCNVVVPLTGPGQKAKARVKASMRKGTSRSVRWVTR